MGFQHLPPERRRELAIKARQANLGGHRFTSAEAKAAGSKGGKKNTKLFTIDGVSDTIPGFAKRWGVSYTTAARRVKRNGIQR